MSWQAVIFLTLTGAVIGSFAATTGLRMAAGRGWASGRSSCDHCATRLAHVATVPVISYAARLGRCSHCRGAISPVHPTGELIGALVLPLLLLSFDTPAAVLLFILAMTLLATSVIDLKTFRLPDALTVIICLSCLGVVALAGVERLLTGVVAAAISFVMLQGLRFAGARLGSDPGLGFGDVKLVTALALWLGVATPIAVAVASLAALIFLKLFRRGDSRVPFGPFIAFAFFGVGLLQEVVPWRVAV